MWTAQTPDGNVTWISDVDYPLFGSAVVTQKLRDASELGFYAYPHSKLIKIDLQNPNDVRYAIETFYYGESTFSENAPEPTEFFDPIDPDAIY